MEAWFIIIVSLCLAALIKSQSLLRRQKSAAETGDFPGHRKPTMAPEAHLRPRIHPSRPQILLRSSNHLANRQSSLDIRRQPLPRPRSARPQRRRFLRPPRPGPPSRVMNRNHKGINSAPYGPTWRLLRRNLTYEILHPTRVKAYSASRRWVLASLIHRLRDTAQSEESVRLIDHFQFAMFSLLVLMCFGDKLREDQIREIEDIQRRLLLGFLRFTILNFWPRFGKILFRNRWNELIQLQLELEKVLVPFINARIQAKQRNKESLQQSDDVTAYVDRLIDLHLPEEDRNLDEAEMVSLCSEFLTGGTDTTSTTLQWIMANLVKHPQYQNTLYQEIISVVGRAPQLDDKDKQFVEEDDLQKMPYLKAVVLEALRRHPPGHFVLPHKVAQDVELGGYKIPKNSIINFMVADMGWDPKVWEDPMEFKPERFLNKNGEAFDITGSREIKMMPFGAGRRVCPGLALALLHLEYFVANLIWYFEWKAL